jgi:hypothetical protein
VGRKTKRKKDKYFSKALDKEREKVICSENLRFIERAPLGDETLGFQ